jgi:hypothetical protein
MSRQDTTIWTVTIDGTPLGRVQRGAGGETSATGHKGWNGGIGEVERGGRKTTSNITLARENNGNPSVAWLRSKINTRCSVHRTPADDDGNPRLAEQIPYTGKLLNVRLDDADTMNDGDIEMWEIEIGVDT